MKWENNFSMQDRSNAMINEDIIHAVLLCFSINFQRKKAISWLMAEAIFVILWKFFSGRSPPFLLIWAGPMLCYYTFLCPFLLSHKKGGLFVQPHVRDMNVFEYDNYPHYSLPTHTDCSVHIRQPTQVQCGGVHRGHRHDLLGLLQIRTRTHIIQIYLGALDLKPETLKMANFPSRMWLNLLSFYGHAHKIISQKRSSPDTEISRQLDN